MAPRGARRSDRGASGSVDNNSGSSSVEEDVGEPVNVLYRTSFRNVIYDVLKARPGWKETESDTDWDFNWADVGWIRDFYDHIQFDDRQRVNHFRNHYELTRKDLLVKNIKRMKRQLERSDNASEANKYNFLPSTYVVPQEYSLFLEEFKKSDGATWIMKPIGKSQGKGIFLFNQLSQISDWKRDHTWKADAPQAEAYVVQRYIQRPLLVGGKKFDMRLYCLVTSYSPLECWIHRAGFARFANTQYSSDPDDLTNSYMHLTNYSIQKTDANYDAEQGIKWHVRDLRLFLASKFGETVANKVFAETQDMIVRALLAVQASIIADKHSFELYGFDVLLDEEFHPWLLEVNASPSITKSGDEDHQIKFDVLSDMLDIIDIEGVRQGDETCLRGFDLVYSSGGFLSQKSYLGCHYESSPIPQRL